MKDRRVIANDLGLQSAIGWLRTAFKKSRYLQVSISDSKPRSLPQNSLAWAWYGQVAAELPDTFEDADHVHRYCKLYIGVPLMRSEDDDFRLAYEGIRLGLTTEQKLQAIRLLPVTSMMNADQLSRYLEAVQRHFVGQVDLQFPEEWQMAA